MIRKLKKKIGSRVGILSTASSGASVFSSYNVCHSICMVVVSLLSIMGVTASATFLLFLQPYSLLLWNIGLAFLVLSLLLYIRFGGCISWKLIMFNGGLIIASFPFFESMFYVFWAVGFPISGYAVYLYIKSRRKK